MDPSARSGFMGLPDLRTVLETAHEAFVSIDAEGRISAWNPEAERTFGWAEEQVLGQKIADVLIPPRYRADHEQGLERFFRTGEGPLLNKRIEISAMHRTGREIPIELTISAVEVEGRWSFHAFVHDISERYRTHELQTRLATLVEHSADAIVSRTAEGVITSWNPGAERLYGYSSDEMIGRTIDAVVPPEREEEAWQLVRRALRGESVIGFETERLTKEGRRIDVSITISPIFDDAGRVRELATFARDISTSKDAQRALVRAYQELQQTTELKSQIVAIASHEFRTPLTSIFGFATTLIQHWQQFPEDERLEYVHIIEREGRRLAALVDDILLFSRIEAGNPAGAPAEVDLAEVAHEVVAELRIETETEVTAVGDRLVLAHPGHVHRILLNFLGNAVAYGEPPFTVEIGEEEGGITARVCDGGPGVPTEFVPRLFDAYTRAAGHYDGGAKGSGLGLAIAKGLAEAAGGEVWYEPNRPRGARLCVRLPSA